MKNLLKLSTLLLASCLMFASNAYAEDNDSAPKKDAMSKRLQKEKVANNNPFLISLYRPSYLLPYSYTTSPYDQVYQNSSQQIQPLRKAEVKFQFSLKVPVWQHVYNDSSTVYAAYSQESFWQAYGSSAFFRETNYEPEIFLANHVNWHTFGDWRLSFLNLGMSHQSNGRGNTLERTWNRVYGEAILSNANWLVSVKPWAVLRDSSLNKYNRDIAKYLGYERLLVSYKIHNHTLSLEARNTFESKFSRGAVQASWSFPLTTNLRGYAQIFSGYGQSLIEYNHFTNSAGVGIALNDWI